MADLKRQELTATDHASARPGGGLSLTCPLNEVTADGECMPSFEDNPDSKYGLAIRPGLTTLRPFAVLARQSDVEYVLLIRLTPAMARCTYIMFSPDTLRIEYRSPKESIGAARGVLTHSDRIRMSSEIAFPTQVHRRPNLLEWTGYDLHLRLKKVNEMAEGTWTEYVEVPVAQHLHEFRIRSSGNSESSE